MAASPYASVNIPITRSAEKCVRAAMVFQIALALYLQIVEWIPLDRWNNVANGNGQGQLDVIIAATQITILIFFWRRWRWIMPVGVAAYAWWAWLEIQSWWIPYFYGASPQWMEVYSRWFKNTYKFLPPIDGHPIPDAEHTVLIALILAVVITGILATVHVFRAPRPSSS